MQFNNNDYENKQNYSEQQGNENIVQRERALVAPNDNNNRIAGYVIDSGTSN